MKNGLWRLPWKYNDVPHALIDIIRGCNITCRSCYNTAPPSVKTLKEISDELDVILRVRKPHSISIIGGEVLLHPQLCDVIRLIKRKNIHTEIFTNGVLLTPSIMSKLTEAGIDVIFLHIEKGQKRIDLSEDASCAEVHQLIEEKAAFISRQGVAVGLTLTVYEDKLDEMIDMVRFSLESRYVRYLLLTLSRDGTVFESIQGDLARGLFGRVNKEAIYNRKDLLTNEFLMELLKNKLDLTPFAYLGSNLNPNALRWLSYSVGTLHSADQPVIITCIKASWVEQISMIIYNLITGRYPFYQKHNRTLFRMQILLNAVTGGYFYKNLRYLWKSLERGTEIKSKRVLLQNMADIDAEGRIIHCLNCPDAVVKNGRLVPVCITDKVGSL